MGTSSTLKGELMLTRISAVGKAMATGDVEEAEMKLETRKRTYRIRGTVREIDEWIAAIRVALGNQGARKSGWMSRGGDGVMIGRGAYGKPWFPAQVQHILNTGERLPDPPAETRCAVTLEHYDALLTHYGERQGVRIARKHLAWSARGSGDMPNEAASIALPISATNSSKA